MIPPLTSMMPSSALQLGSHLQQAQGRFSLDAMQQPASGYASQAMHGISAMGNPQSITAIDGGSPASGGVNFKSVLANTIGQVNQTVQQPDALLKQLMSGNSNVDIHDVVMANTKAELAVTLTSQVLTKVIQAYERVSQIQV
jgi:flagellar hook-basal body complex protein FliE